MREDAQKGQRQEVVFRRMEAADAAAAAQVEAVSSREAWTEKAFLDAVRRPDVVYVVAQQGERVVGCCGLWESFDEGDICNVAVLPECRRQGIACGMLLFLMEQGRLDGVKNYTLEVRKGSREAVLLYQKLGFVTEGVRKDFYSDPAEDALIMWKRVSCPG